MMEPWQAMLAIVALSIAAFLVFKLLVARFWSKPRGTSSASNHAYDKAKYHYETIEEFGLPAEHACNPATFFLSWLIKNRLMSRRFERDGQSELALYLAGRMPINTLYYQRCDGCLMSDMLNDEGNAFAISYFDFQRGQYLQDYKTHLQKDLQSEFHVEYTPENERLIHTVIDKRYGEWKEHGSL